MVAEFGIRLRWSRNNQNRAVGSGRRVRTRAVGLESCEERFALNAAPMANADSVGLVEDTALVAGNAGQTQAGLVNHWKFDESTGNMAVDTAGGNDGTLFNWGGGEPKWVSGRLG